VKNQFGVKGLSEVEELWMCSIAELSKPLEKEREVVATLRSCFPSLEYSSIRSLETLARPKGNLGILACTDHKLARWSGRSIVSMPFGPASLVNTTPIDRKWLAQNESCAIISGENGGKQR
jgi:hypothetical protein